jgi:hypothetical protein
MFRHAPSPRLTERPRSGRRGAGEPAVEAEAAVPRYIVERSFPEGFELPYGRAGIDVCRGVIGVNEDLGVTWVHSYVRDDRRSTFCVYDAPNPEAIRRAAQRNGLPVDRITRVNVLDPYFYTPSAAADVESDVPGRAHRSVDR